jgi:Ca2+-binding EF-hand superfamily protein
MKLLQMRYCWYVVVCALCLCSAGIQADQKEANLGRRDLLLLLPSGPMHIRLRITDGARSLDQLRSEYLDRLIVRLDTNKDGQLTSDETRNHALFMTGKRFSDTPLARPLTPARGMSRSAVEQSIERAIGQSMVFRQIGSVAEQDLQVFKVLDEDQSGLIERHEMRTSSARLAARDLDHDYCVTFDEFVSNANSSMMSEVVMTMAALEPPPPVHSELLRDAREPVMASRLIRIYDTDKDAKLSNEELHWDKARVALLDQNHDGVLAVAELSKIADADPDIHVEIELSSSNKVRDSEGQENQTDSKKPLNKDKVQLISARQTASARLLDGGVIEIKQPSTTIIVSYRPRDPIEESMRNARETFNSIDVDANGYMDREEITTQRELQNHRQRSAKSPFSIVETAIFRCWIGTAMAESRSESFEQPRTVC